MQNAKAVNTRTLQTIADQVEIANTLLNRMVGLIGKTQLADGHAMLIKRSGNSIHTFFMKFPIDLIFMDSTGKVRWLSPNVKPWKIVVAPIFGRTDCLELPSGMIEKTKTLLGDVIRVES